MRSRATRRSARNEEIVPIVEPEVLMDGAHDAERCYAVTEWVLKTLYMELFEAKVPLEGTVLKPNMVIAGKKCAKRASVEEVAEKTVRVLKACVPSAVPGIAFLSGGQSDEEATAHLDAMNRIGGSAVEAHLFLRACLAGGAAEGMVRQGGKRGGGATRFRPSRPDERACDRRPLVGDIGEESGLSRPARGKCRSLSPAFRAYD